MCPLFWPLKQLKKCVTLRLPPGNRTISVGKSTSCARRAASSLPLLVTGAVLRYAGEALLLCVTRPSAVRVYAEVCVALPLSEPRHTCMLTLRLPSPSQYGRDESMTARIMISVSPRGGLREGEYGRAPGVTSRTQSRTHARDGSYCRGGGGGPAATAARQCGLSPRRRLSRLLWAVSSGHRPGHGVQATS